MQEILKNQPDPERGKRSPIILILSILVLAAIGPVLWVAVKSPDGNSSRRQLALSLHMNPEELAYIKNIQVENIVLSRAENFLHQEVTVLDADAINTGKQTVAGMNVTVEFFDDLHQVVLRETRSVLGIPPVALAPGQKRSFSISFDRVPSSWNLQQPSVQVVYLQLATVK